MTKIVQISGDSSSTGAPSHVFRLSRGLKENGFEIVLIAPKGPLLKRARGENIKTYEVRMRGVFDRDADHKIREIIRTESPDIVHCHGTRGGWLGRLAARKVEGVKIVYTEHLWTEYFHLPNYAVESFQLNGLKFMERWTDRTIAVSKSVCDFLISKGFDKNKITVIPNGIDPQFLDHQIIDKPEGAPLIIGSVGSLNPIKNYRNAILAISKLKKKYPDENFHYQIIGEGPLLQGLKNLARARKVDKRTHFAGRVESVTERLQHFSIFLNVSLSESFGLAVGEAMAMGLPVVASDIKPLKWLVSKDCGLFVNPRNSDQIAQALEKLLFDKKLRKQMGDCARVRIANKFSEKAMVKNTIDLYQDILKNKKYPTGQLIKSV